jgi:hypothetical protein
MAATAPLDTRPEIVGGEQCARALLIENRSCAPGNRLQAVPVRAGCPATQNRSRGVGQPGTRSGPRSAFATGSASRSSLCAGFCVLTGVLILRSRLITQGIGAMLGRR